MRNSRVGIIYKGGCPITDLCCGLHNPCCTLHAIACSVLRRIYCGLRMSHYCKSCDFVDCPTVFHMPINGRVARLNLVMSRGHADDQSLGRSPGFPGSRVVTCDSCFPGSRGVTRDTCNTGGARDFITCVFPGSCVGVFNPCFTT